MKFIVGHDPPTVKLTFDNRSHQKSEAEMAMISRVFGLHKAGDCLRLVRQDIAGPQDDDGEPTIAGYKLVGVPEDNTVEVELREPAEPVTAKKKAGRKKGG